MKILINTPSILEARGGVANHYKGLKPFWNEDVNYNFIGDRYGIPGPLILPYDIIKFIIKCLRFRPDLILLNPSLGKNALKRDSIFLWLGKTFFGKVAIFFHGWDKNIEDVISKDSTKFLKSYSRADYFLVLSKDFKALLKNWGISRPIFLTTTKVDNLIIENFNINNKVYRKNILFLARIEEKKGIFESLKIFENLKTKYPDATLSVVGEGAALEEAKNIVKTQNIKDVVFFGKLNSEGVKNAFQNSDIYLLPTSHGEGMPTSVLEAMAFGLPVISRPVGGLPDFFINKKMGYLVEGRDLIYYQEFISELFNHREKMEEIGEFNHSYAMDNFLASKVASKLEQLFLSNN